MKKIIIALALAITVGGVMVSCSSETDKGANDNKPAVSQEKKDYSVGDTVKVENKEIKVESVKTSNGSEFDKPKEGKEYLVVKLNIKNVGDENISYNPLNYSVKNGEGQITDMAMSIVDQDTALSSGELAPEGKVTGTIVFEVPKGDKKVELLYKENAFSDKVAATIKLS